MQFCMDENNELRCQLRKCTESLQQFEVSNSEAALTLPTVRSFNRYSEELRDLNIQRPLRKFWQRRKKK